MRLVASFNVNWFQLSLDRAGGALMGLFEHVALSQVQMSALEAAHATWDRRCFLTSNETRLLLLCCMIVVNDGRAPQLRGLGNIKL